MPLATSLMGFHSIFTVPLNSLPRLTPAAKVFSVGAIAPARYHLDADIKVIFQFALFAKFSYQDTLLVFE